MSSSRSDKLIEVLLIAPASGVVGGILNWTKTIRNYYETLSESKVSLTLFDFGRRKSGQLAGNIFRRIYLAISEYLRLTKNASRAIKASDADVVHICTPGSFLLLKDIVLCRCAKKSGKKVILHFHFGRIPGILKKGWWEKLLLKGALKRTELSIVMDNKSYQSLLRAGYSNVVNIPNPIDLGLFANMSRHPEAIRSDMVLFVGHVLPSKGVSELVQACGRMKSVHLRIAGSVSEDYRRQLLETAAQLEYSDIMFLGELSREEAVNEMTKASVLALPSYTEGFPNVILEGMAAGCPIVATNVGAIPQMLNVEDQDESKHAGICVIPKDEAQLECALRRMLENVQLAETFSRNAGIRVREEYEMSNVWKQLESVWRQSIFGA